MEHPPGVGRARGGALHRAIDALATWTEDRVRREASPFRPAPPAPLSCFGPLPPLPPAPPAAGRYRASIPGGELLVRVLPARAAPRGTAILVPPWKLRGEGLLAPWAGAIRRAGLDAWVVTLPHHGARTARGARSGEGFFSNDLAATRAALEGLVLELRVLAALARPRGTVAVVGLSLGALGAALAATAPEGLDAAALVAPPADLGAVLSGTAIGRRYRRLAERAGAPIPSAEALRDALAPLDPARRAPTARRILVAAGAHDAIALPGPAVALARAWGGAARVYPRGHLTLLLACAAARRELAAFLRG